MREWVEFEQTSDGGLVRVRVRARSVVTYMPHTTNHSAGVTTLFLEGGHVLYVVGTMEEVRNKIEQA